MYCQHCGQLVKEGAKFCIYCGMPLSFTAEPTMESRTEPVPESPIKQNTQRHPVSSTPPATAQETIAEQEPLQSKSTVRLDPVIPRKQAAQKPQMPLQTPTGKHEEIRGIWVMLAIISAFLVGLAISTCHFQSTKPAGDDAEVVSEQCAVTFLGGGAQQGSMEPLTCAKGETLVLPVCGFTREGHSFDCWEDDLGRCYAAGDEVVIDGDMSFRAVWIAQSSEENQDSGVDEGHDDALSASFPKSWSGSFEGYSQHVTGGTYNTSIRIAFSTIGSDGHLVGTCYIGYEDSQAATGSYHVEGQVDWTTGKVSLAGTTWEDQGELEYMRAFEGTIDSDFTSITGTSQRNDGTHQGYWTMRAG